MLSTFLQNYYLPKYNVVVVCFFLLLAASLAMKYLIHIEEVKNKLIKFFSLQKVAPCHKNAYLNQGVTNRELFVWRCEWVGGLGESNDVKKYLVNGFGYFI